MKFIYLVGFTSSKLNERKLPTNRQVLRVFFHHFKVLKQKVRESAMKIVDEVNIIWSQTGIIVVRSDAAWNQVKNLYYEWAALLKNKCRKKSPTHKLNEKKFDKKLDQLFDIALEKKFFTLTENQKHFLINQRNQKRPSPIPIDLIPAQVNYTPISVESEQELSRGISSCSLTDEINTQSSSNSEGLKRTISNFEDEMPRRLRPKRMNIMNPELISTLDRTKLSSRKAAHVIAATSNAVQRHVSKINCSASTIHRHRSKVRKSIVDYLKKNLRTAQSLVLHWDGKLLPDIEGTKKVGRLPVVLSGLSTEQLIGVPKLKSETGLNQAVAIIELLNEWKCVNNVKALCFDTTSVNTGRMSGTCVLLKKKLNRSFLHLACRHHVFELVLRSVVETCWPGTCGPNSAVFMRFKGVWAGIDKTQFETGIQDEEVATILEDKKEGILQFISDQIEEYQPRGDYKEFLNLACIFLGGLPRLEIKFKVPGAVHHARWLAKAIYCLKMFLFRKQFHMKPREASGLRHVCLFIVIFYVRAWFTCPSAIKAPHHDLKLLQDLIAYKSINARISKAAAHKFSNHLWYLSDELAPLSFFDESVPLETKIKMVHSLKTRKSTGNVKRAIVQEADFDSLHMKDVSNFITKKSSTLFEALELSTSFLDLDPGKWESNASYNDSLAILKSVNVVNDVAERAVALITEFNEFSTKDEEQKQYLLQVVRNHRNTYPTCNKANYTNTTIVE